ncbi:MAG: hypothetical protein HFG26_13390, partial [Provencibacterium sp.]|nr:hypothetical protein [Provencibacterium sp.]
MKKNGFLIQPTDESAGPAKNLLYQANFKDSGWGFLQKDSLKTPQVEVSQDGSSVAVAGAAGSGYYWGGEIPGMPLKGNNYTMEFSITRSTNEGSGCAGVHVFHDRQDLNGNGAASYGFYTFSSRQMYAVQYQVGNRAFGPVGYGFTTYPMKDTDIQPDGKATQFFRYLIDGEKGVITCYIRSEGSYRYVASTPLLHFGTENLAIRLFTYGADVFVQLHDVRIYSGLCAAHGITPLESSEPLLELSDLTQPAAGSQGAAYTPNIRHSSADIATYSYDDAEGATISTVKNSKAGTQVFGGTTNLSLNIRSKYTVTYQTKQPIGAGTGLRISSNGSYNNSTGFYDSLGEKGCIPFGSYPNGYALYAEYPDSMKQNGSIYIDNGYNNVAIEIDGYQMAVYINGVLFTTGNVGVPLNAVNTYGYASDVLTLVFHDYYLETDPGTVKSRMKNIKVYAGLLLSNGAKRQTGNIPEKVAGDNGALTISGNPAGNYKIVYHAKRFYSQEAANRLHAFLLDKTGMNLPIVPDTEPESPFEILVGNTNRQESRDVCATYDRPNVYYTIQTAGDKLLIVHQGKMSGDKALSAFESYLNGMSGAIFSIPAGLLLSGDCKEEAYALCPQDTDMRVMQSNLLFTEAPTGYTYQQRAELSADIYLAALPDIITFNEFVNDISYRIADLIKDYYTVDKAPFENAYDFSDVEDPRLGSFQGTPIAYRTSKYAVVDSGFRLYGGERNYVHHLSWGLFKDLSTGHVFLVSSNHYGDQAMPGGGKFTFYAEQTFRRVKEILKTYGEIPALLCGDWFFWKNQAPYNYLLQNGYVDATDQALTKNSAGVGTFHTIGVCETNRVIEDLIFFKPDSLTALTHKVYINYNSVQSSDHYPVVVDFKFNVRQVFFDANGGSDAPGSQIVNGTNLTLTSSIPTRPGFYFDGWDTNPAGSTRVYLPKQSYTLNQNVTL